MKDKIKNIKFKPAYILFLLSLIFTSAVMKFLPDSVPMHYDFNGNIDRYGSKYEMFLYPGILLFFIIFFGFMGRFMKKCLGENPSDEDLKKFKTNEKILGITAVVIVLFEFAMEAAAVYKIMSSSEKSQNLSENQLGMILTILMSCLYIVLGNYLPKTKRNSILGLRTRHTLSDDLVWQKSNRVCGIAMIITGVLSIAASFIFKGMLPMYILLFLTSLSIIISVFYAASVPASDSSSKQ